MVDTQTAPQLAGELPEAPGSISEAQGAILGLMDSLEKPEEEEQAPPSEETTEDALEETIRIIKKMNFLEYKNV